MRSARILLVILSAFLPGAWASETADILFHATFDQDAKAEVASDGPEGSPRGPVTFEPGKSGKALVAGENFARVAYQVGRNLDTQQGSLALWIKAVDWLPSEKRSHLFFNVQELGLFRLYTDEAGELVFEVGTDLAQSRKVSASLAAIPKDEWFQVAATWSSEQLRLYLNGTLSAEAPCEATFLPLIVNTSFELGDSPRARGRETPRKTLLDDLVIYRRPLEARALGSVAPSERREKAPPYEPPTITVGPTARPIRVDGELAPGEWEQAAVCGNFLNVSDYKLAPIQTVACATYDSSNLYFAVQSPILTGIPLKAASKNRDDPVWNDDAVQLYLTPPGAGTMFLLISNSKGVLYDRKDHKGLDNDVAWNGNWRVASKTTADSWTLEVGIAFADLGVPPPRDGETWRLNVTRDRVQPQNLSCWPRLSAFADSENHGLLRFTKASPVVQVPSFGPVLNGTVAFNPTVFVPAGRDSKLLAKLTAAREGVTIHEKSQVWDAAGGQRHTYAIQERVTSGAPDTLSFTVRDQESGTVYYHDTVLLGEQAGLTVRCEPIPSKGLCKVFLDERNPTVLATNPSAVVELVSRQSATPVRTLKLEPFVSGRASGEFEIAQLDSGQYDLRAQVVGNGRTLDQGTVEFVKPDEPWRALHVGRTEEVPPPWTPMQCTTNASGSLQIDCWGRRHQFDGSVLPSQIQNGGSNMLAAPISLEMRVAGRPLAWKGAITKVEQSAAKVRFSARQESDAIVVESTAYMEFDGMLWCDISITPSREVSVESLDLVIPLRAEVAKFRQIPHEVEKTGATGCAHGWQWLSALPRTFYFWLGNEDLGLTWFFERLDQFRSADADKTVELYREDNIMYLKLHYFARPVPLTQPIELAFGLQATPVKARPTGWRDWGSARPAGVNIDIPWTSEEINRYGGGYPEATNPSYYQRLVQSWKREGAKVVPYNVILWHPIESPEWKYYQADWDLGGGVNKYHDTRTFWWGGRVCGAAESFIDWITWKMRRHIEEYRLDGVYHDLQWSYRCGNANHGCAGGRRALRGDRELNKRLYVMMKQIQRPLFKIDHASNGICSMYHGFCDMFTTGEEMRIFPALKPEKYDQNGRIWDDYFKAMRLDYFKACGATGRQWGVVPMLLLQMTEAGTDATEGIFSILLAHDAIPTWDALSRDVHFMNRLQQTLAEFGIGGEDVEFLPYWHENTPAKVVTFTPTGGGPIRPVQVEYEVRAESRLAVEDSFGASVYRRNLRSLIVVFNYTQDDAIADLQLDLVALGIDPNTAIATDAFTRFQWTKAAGAIRVPVKKKNFRLVWVESATSAGLEPGAMVADFPQEVAETQLAGYRPEQPEKLTSDAAIVGDLWNEPWTGPLPPGRPALLRTELAQTFTLAAAAVLQRIEVRLTDSPGQRDFREPIRIRIVKAAADGLPLNETVVLESEFATPWIVTEQARFAHFHLKRAHALQPGRYAIILSRKTDHPDEHFHARCPSFPGKVYEGGKVSVRLLAADGSEVRPWQTEDKVLTFALHGILR